jgi:hypothetical protein
MGIGVLLVALTSAVLPDAEYERNKRKLAATGSWGGTSEPTPL